MEDARQLLLGLYDDINFTTWTSTRVENNATSSLQSADRPQEMLTTHGSIPDWDKLKFSMLSVFSFSSFLSMN